MIPQPNPQPWPGPCEGCCTCPEPYWALETRSASKSKCGIQNPENTGSWYLQSVETIIYTASGSHSSSDSSSTCSVDTDYAITTTVTVGDTGSCAYACSGSGSSSYSSYYTLTNPNGHGSFTRTTSETGSITGCSGGTLEWSVTGSTVGTGSGSNYSGSSWNYTHPISTTTTGKITNLGGGCETNVTQSDTTVYSNEYTTAQLQSNTINALPAWGGLPAFATVSGTSNIASRELSSNSATYSIQQCQYQFAHPVPLRGGYALSWVEQFQPDGDGAPTNTPRTYTWDGTTPPGYNPSDPSTWPTTTVYTIDQPSSNGSVSLINLVWTCP